MRLLRLLTTIVGWTVVSLVLALLLGVGRARAGVAPRPKRGRRAALDVAPAADHGQERPAVPVPVPVPAAASAVRRAPRRAGARAVPLAPRPRRRTRSRPGVGHTALALLRLPVTLAGWSAAGIMLGLLLALTVPLAVGMRPLVVLSGSMEPVLHVGDVTVVQRIAPREARVGDVVTFKGPGTGRITTHRVRAMRHAGRGRVAFTTKGDANNAFERWTLPADGQLSRAVYTVPLVGHALLLIRTPLGWALLVGLPLLLLAGQEIRRIWRAAPASEGVDAPLVA